MYKILINLINVNPSTNIKLEGEINMEENNKFRTLKPYQGILLFILVILMMIFVATPIQMRYGMYGVAITELIILAMAVIPAILLKADLKEVFPIKKPTIGQIFGIIILWIGTFLGVTLVTLILGYFFPEGLGQVSAGLNDVITSIPMGIAFFIVAIMPAICEEALTRGFILSSFNSFKSKWSIIILVAIIFGIFHMDPFRFLQTAILGGALAYIMVETKNILLPVLFHFINNGLTTLVSFVSQSQETAVAATQFNVPLVSIGSYFIIGSAIPFLFLLGSILIHKKDKTDNTSSSMSKRSVKKIYVAAFITVVMLIIGAVIISKNLSDIIF